MNRTAHQRNVLFDEDKPREHGDAYCTAWFSGDYPTSIEAGGSKKEYEM
jgi:hypothetical protein